MQEEQYFSLARLLSIGISLGLNASFIISSIGLDPYGPIANGGHCLGIKPGFFKDTEAKKNKERLMDRTFIKKAAGLLCSSIK